MTINCVERVLIAVADLDAARERWARAGFALASDDCRLGALGFAQMAAGAVEIDLCTAAPGATGALASAVLKTSARGGGIIGWVWCIDDHRPLEPAAEAITLPGLAGEAIRASVITGGLAGVFSAATPTRSTIEDRRAALALRGENPNTVRYLDHVVIMAPDLEQAIAANETIGVACKRIREAGRGIRQAFFKLEETVLEVAGPARGRPGCWGLAFMCGDIDRAVALARENGFQATEPKVAVQGGRIARIIEPLDGVAIAFMQAQS